MNFGYFLWNDGRPSPSHRVLDVDLLGDAQSVVDFDTKVFDCAVHIGVTQKELDRPKIAGLPINQRGLWPDSSKYPMTAFGKIGHLQKWS